MTTHFARPYLGRRIADWQSFHGHGRQPRQLPGQYLRTVGFTRGRKAKILYRVGINRIDLIQNIERRSKYADRRTVSRVVPAGGATPDLTTEPNMPLRRLGRGDRTHKDKWLFKGSPLGRLPYTSQRSAGRQRISYRPVPAGYPACALDRRSGAERLSGADEAPASLHGVGFSTLVQKR